MEKVGDKEPINPKFNIATPERWPCWHCMDSVQLYRNRAAHLRQLASDERDVTVRQQLSRAAIGFDQFADELEDRQVRDPDEAYTDTLTSGIEENK